VPLVEVTAWPNRDVLALQKLPVFRFGLERDDELVRIIGDDQEDLPATL
jgi:hypothetical protein